MRYNGLDRGDASAGLDGAGDMSDDPWEALEKRLINSRLKYLDSVPESERQFLGWPSE